MSFMSKDLEVIGLCASRHNSVGVESWLDEIKSDITRETPASFEPTIDYVVTKIPRFAFEKFPQGACARPPFRKLLAHGHHSRSPRR